MSEESGVPVTVNLTDAASQKEIELTLTVGQVQLIYNFLAQNIQPKGVDMIEFTHDLFNRLKLALDEVSQDEPLEDEEGPTDDGF